MVFRQFIDKKFSFVGEPFGRLPFFGQGSPDPGSLLGGRPSTTGRTSGRPPLHGSCPIYRAITPPLRLSQSRAGMGEGLGEDKKSLRKEVKLNEDY